MDGAVCNWITSKRAKSSGFREDYLKFMQIKGIGLGFWGSGASFYAPNPLNYDSALSISPSLSAL